jgi:dTDP-3-amino-2,3,6-trideoxy-4-keto-D-glucose/dTDP-3-amino-3,4,6-trideoxy-alpha-D-glucose/dTDP-2,6-dideoxy-D-kanosamine transaminase
MSSSAAEGRPLAPVGLEAIEPAPIAAPPVPLNDLARQYRRLHGEIGEAVGRVLAGGRYVLGENVVGFEHAFAQYCGVAHCAGVANGTDALEIALRALGCGHGDDVVTVANAGMYATGAILAVGARPILVDISPSSMTMDPAALARALRPQTKAVVVTHLYGKLAELQAIGEMASARNIPIVEDCAQAHGAARGGKKAGAFGTIGCFSFYPTKNLGAMGDGGAIVTGDASIAQAARELREYGWRTKYSAVRTSGRNSRLDEIQAAILRAKLPYLDGWNDRRRQIANRFRQAFSGSLVAPVAASDDVAHLCVLRTLQRSVLQAHLARDGIASDIHYPVLDYRQPALQGIFAGDIFLPQSEAASREVLTIPCFPELTEQEIERIADSLVRFARWESRL